MRVPGMNDKEEKNIYDWLVTQSFPDGILRVRLDNEDLILDHI
ncbi:hypothetical protein GCM10007863_46020 [Dyella mobilis]|uniref:Uncharacterized protein n=1 Tax=Zoogloea oryzae TaxID=310767 RepID=A0ABQ6FHR9_9RHOO|nr:hypothetical protein GCM10007863_46020 [Dyella mobilis]GLT24786.1 hypothetical protein GCM10007933_42870 [Zoogloea oryzae]